MNIFEMLYPRFYFDKSKPIKLFEAFSGVGCQAMALKRITDKYELIGFSEIDVHAIKSYQAIHGEVKNYGDITMMGEIPPCDIFTWSFPCTDLSKAGKQKGLSGGTRSGLVYEVLRLLHATEIKPKVLIMENVVDLVQVKFVEAFNEIQRELEELGYTNYNEVLNAKDFEIPQNRERVFMVSILADEENEHYAYDFPIKRPLKIRLKDVLEENVDEKYYLSAKNLKMLTKELDGGYDRAKRFQSNIDKIITEGVAGAVCAGHRTAPNDAYWAEETMQGGGLEPKVAIKTWNDETKAYKTKENDMPRDRIYTEESIGFTITTNESQMPFVAELRTDEGIRTFKDGLVGTLRTTESCGDKIVIEESNANKEATNIKNVMTDVASTLGTNCGSSTSAGGGVVLIPEATTKGYAEAHDGDGIYINRPEQKRGVVQKGMIPTLKTSGNDVGVVVSELKAELAEKLLEQGKVREFDVIRHSYTKNRLNNGEKNMNRVQSKDNDVSPTLDTRCDCLGIVVQQKAIGNLKSKNKRLKTLVENTEFKESETKNLDIYNQRVSDLSQTLTQPNHNNQAVYHNLRIRKLIPLECWRLMGISDEDFYKAKNVGISNSQLYKQAGNGIVVNVFEAILREMIK